VPASELEGDGLGPVVEPQAAISTAATTASERNRMLLSLPGRRDVTVTTVGTIPCPGWSSRPAA
jgi:hypothetical protein